ncbi:hypothetical protein PTQ21_12155 [Paenibacillus marchantiae]|uniref:hypothetical protein n=1 Tax=Paenibacillus marchantiae TaxID=3026433 RepID=UPI00237C4656|nr:hypothetical protein [Paenibacillus marchantiae]WDQ34943.1 hypothetical protein PTQ21_12155 [Paenibacillus marchantiae]
MRKMLATTEDFERYMNFKRPIVVLFNSEKEEGVITSHNDFTVKVNGNYFGRESCEFWSK